MRNPLLFSTELFVKRAAQGPVLNIPKFDPKSLGPTLSEKDMKGMMSNIESYPTEQRQAIYDSINKNYGQAKHEGGLFGNMMGGLKNWGSGIVNDMQQGANEATNSLFGWQPFDTQDDDRFRAQTVLQNASKNPEMYASVANNLQDSGTFGAKTQAPAANATPAPKAPVQAPVAATTTPAPTQTQTPAPLQPAPIPAPPATPTPIPAAPAPAPVQAASPAPAPAPVNLVSTPSNAGQQASANPAPRKEGLIDGIPASQWIAQNKARQQQGIGADPAEVARSRQVSNYYNPTPAAQTTNRWGGSRQPAQLDAGQQYQKDWVNGTFDKNREAKKTETRNTEAMNRGQARINELTAQHGKSYWDGAEGQKDLARYQKGIF